MVWGVWTLDSEMKSSVVDFHLIPAINLAVSSCIYNVFKILGRVLVCSLLPELCFGYRIDGSFWFLFLAVSSFVPVTAVIAGRTGCVPS